MKAHENMTDEERIDYILHIIKSWSMNDALPKENYIWVANEVMQLFADVLHKEGKK